MKFKLNLKISPVFSHVSMLLIGAVTIVGATYFVYETPTGGNFRKFLRNVRITVEPIAQPLAPPLAQPTASQEEMDKELGEHTLRTMEYVKSPLSPLQRQLHAQMLVIMANNTFQTIEQKKDWIRVLAIESRFDNAAKSTADAVGLGQILPQYVKTFGKPCGMDNAKESDATDLLVNAAMSACVWRNLIETVPDHSVILALSAYNSGPSSQTTKNIRNLGSANPETANYILRFNYVKEQTDIQAKKIVSKSK